MTETQAYCGKSPRGELLLSTVSKTYADARRALAMESGCQSEERARMTGYGVVRVVVLEVV